MIYELLKDIKGGIVQIGGHVASTDDPVYRAIKDFGIRALIAEPNSESFKGICSLYAGCSVNCVRAAIAEKTGTVSFYAVGGKGIGWSSLSRDHISDKMIQRKAEVPIQEVSVASFTLEDFLDKYLDFKMGAFLCDAEGYDYKVMKQLDLEKHHPSVACYEHCHITQAENSDCIKKLKESGYEIHKTKLNVIGKTDD